HMAAVISIRRRSPIEKGPIWRDLACQARFAAVFVPVILAIGSNLSAQAPQTSEYQVKAAYLANFPKFVEWPAQVAKSESFNICVLGQDPFGVALDAAVAGESIDSIPIAAKR